MTDNPAVEQPAHANEPWPRRWQIFLLAIAIMLADDWAVDLAHPFRVWANLPKFSQWNWFGKAASIALSCLLLACFPWLRHNVGLRWRQAPGSLKLSVGCFAAYLTAAIAIGFLVPPLPFSGDTLAFQFLMPGVAEELMCRGILLALFERAFGQSPMSCRLRFGYAALLTSIIFGLGHGLSYEDGHYQLSWLLFSTTAVWGAMAALVRTRSGSLLWPILCHGAWDGSIFLVAMVR
jgi:CAAX protease family protein